MAEQLSRYNVFRCMDNNLYKYVFPDFIYNRFDLWNNSSGCQVCLWCCESVNNKFYFETFQTGNKLYLGIWLMPITKQELKEIIREVFRSENTVNEIYYNNGYLKAYGKYVVGNHFKICLPGSIEELEQRLSKKGRYNLRREKRLLEKDFLQYSIVNISATAESADALWEKYFYYKYITHSTDYKMTKKEYCDKYHVTDIYALLIGQDEHCAAIVLSCEQCRTAYIDNITFDLGMAKYSPGQVLYDEYLKCLIRKGVRCIYLLGGDYGYKRRYGSIEETVYNCSIPRSLFKRTEKWGICLAKELYHFIKDKLSE